jgi:peptidoglycan/LPS O-acetylase OafA/YrhL
MKESKNPFTLFHNTRYFPSLDGMRALFVTLVMFNHVHVRTPWGMHAPLGVIGFFVLSGFLITTLMLREKEKYGRISLKAFYARRFFRIVPVYFFTILLYAGVLWRLHDRLKTASFESSLPWLLTFMEEYRTAAAGNVMGHAWSLGVEEKFYLFWPLLIVLMIPFRGRKAVLLAAVAVGVLLFPYPYYISYGSLLIGAVLAIALDKQASWNFLHRIPAVPDVVILIVLIAAYASFNRDTNGNSLLFAGAVALLIASLVLRTGLVRRVLENPVFVFVGKRSYSFYLIHVLAIDFVEKVLAQFVTLNWANVIVVAFLVSLAVASSMHIAIELPCISLGRRLTKRFAHHEPVSPAAT